MPPLGFPNADRIEQQPVRGSLLTVDIARDGAVLARPHSCLDDTAKGVEQQLLPDTKSAEGHRANFNRAHPALSREIGFLSLIMLVIGLMMLIPQAIVPLAQLPPVADHFGTFTSPIDLPIWLNIATTVLIGMASTERALRLRYNLLLDGAAG